MRQVKYIFSIVLVAVVTLVSCERKAPPTQQWVLEKTIELPGVNPIGIGVFEQQFWLSDGDHNRLVAVDTTGLLTDSITGLDRPMHIDATAAGLWVPQYGSDTIAQFKLPSKFPLPLILKDSLDAPASISVFGQERAIADFYNHRILYFNGMDWISIGTEGKEAGQFYYPTDVQITADHIWVADAYNNRIQLFNKQGAFVRIIGADQKMNAATGLFVSENQVFVTDFEHHRLLVFFKDGQLAQVIEAGLEKPIDAIIHEEKLYVIDYKKQQMNRYYFDH
ncbi:NHL repeat-containing protein [Flavobacteriaceae bacterium]|nr:NHL repeat-containing protein [Flavobacteriaceae bacterium]